MLGSSAAFLLQDGHQCNSHLNQPYFCVFSRHGNVAVSGGYCAGSMTSQE